MGTLSAIREVLRFEDSAQNDTSGGRIVLSQPLLEKCIQARALPWAGLVRAFSAENNRDAVRMKKSPEIQRKDCHRVGKYQILYNFSSLRALRPWREPLLSYLK